MALRRMTWTITRTPDADPETVWQLVMSANDRLALLGVQIMPQGTTSATAALQFDIGIQDGAGTSADDTANLIKNRPEWDGTPSNHVTALKTFTAEAASTVVKYNIALHQQSEKMWRPPDGYLVMDPAERWAMRVHGNPSFAIVYNVFFEI